MRPWQAMKEKSQKIRKVEGRILYGRDGSSVPTLVGALDYYRLDLCVTTHEVV